MAEADLIAPTAMRVAVQKPKFGIYYALLIIALCAMITSCIVLYIYIRAFGGFGAVKGKVAVVELSDAWLISDRIATADYSVAVATSGWRAPNSRSRSNSAAGSSLTSWNL